ncbi:unnamed protein product [Umbelopsis sp. WA50703]
MADGLNSCSVGITAPTPLQDLDGFVEEAMQTNNDFVVVPIASENYSRVLFESAGSKQAMDEWRAGLPLTPNDLILKKVDWAGVCTGVFSDWIDLESSEDRIRINSEIAIKQEATWVAHLGLPAVLVPVLPPDTISNFARVIGSLTSILPYAHILVRVPMSQSTDGTGWLQWNTFHNLTETNPKLSVALELSRDLPEDESLTERWFSEPIKSVIIPANVFIANQKGYPVLPKKHQFFVKSLMKKFKPSFVITAAELGLHEAGGPSAYQEYIRYLNRSLPTPDQVEAFATGYQDYLQAPLQPLMDNLESATYETFEKDPIKYQQYEEAVYRALIDRVPEGSEVETVIMVVGAGRGPLVNCSIRASERAQRKVKLYAVEKNPNALVTLQNMKAEAWHDRVTIVYSDMRKWKAPEKCDILVSELLGSFGDNELSPECLDGAQKFLKPDGISIPSSYTTYIAPLSSSKLCNEVAAYKDLEHSETPYVVMFQQVSHIAEPKSIWTFHHPNREDIDGDCDPLHNYHNVRRQSTRFHAKENGMLHGIAGYFDSVLYKDVMISIHPETHSPGMFSWFPIFFPLRTPIFVPQGASIDIDFWRLTDNKKVWYEWKVSQCLEIENKIIELGTSPIHNTGGRSSWIGL